MNNPDLTKARDWADRTVNQEVSDGVRAAVDTIHSLPDQWVDAEKVRGLIKPYVGSETAGPALWHLAKDLEALLTPPLPTLADMTPEERKACQWMQADVSLQGETLRVAITRTVERYSSVEVIDPNGFQVSYDHELVTPLPDLPRLEWPAQEPHLDKDSLSGMWADDGSSPSDDIEFLLDKYEDHDLPRPEDVPPGEPWIVEVRGIKWTGTRSDTNPSFPWRLTRMDVEFDDYATDSQVTLMPRLVPEVQS